MIQRLSTALVLLLAPLGAQQTIVVQGGGDAFRLAVQSANPGDVLLVRAGSYSGGVVDKGLTVRCDPGVGFWPLGRSAGLVTDVPAGQVFLLQGGSVIGLGGLFPSLVTDGVGTTIFEGVAVAANARLGGSQVSFHACGFGSVFVSTLTAPARVAFAECTLTETFELDGGSVSISGGTVTGTTLQLFGGLPAIRLRSGELTIAGDASTVLTAGTGGPSPAPAIETTSGLLVLGPQVQLVSSAPAPITGPATVANRFLPSIRATPAVAGQTFTATVHAEVGSSTHVLVSLPQTPWATPFGTLWISPNSLVLDTGIVPASGTRTTSLVLPANLPANVPLVLQSITTLTSGALWVGPPTSLFSN